MSSRFWIASAFVMAGSIATGVSLGGFASGHDAGGAWRERPGYAADDASISDTSLGVQLIENPPSPFTDGPTEPVVCKGCGPTLAERQMSADAFVTSTDDPWLRDYETQREPAGEPAAIALPETLPPHGISSPPPVRPTLPPASAPMSGGSGGSVIAAAETTLQ
ncbi:MAG: hypothetical protein DI547_10625 [Sphingobium sp.]|nr:MAG: hypothetical protein DI547_10625 [Sphingobium sp.]